MDVRQILDQVAAINHLGDVRFQSTVLRGSVKVELCIGDAVYFGSGHNARDARNAAAEEALTAMYDLLDPFLELHFRFCQSGKKAVFNDLDPIKKRTLWRASVSYDGELYVGEGTSKKLARVAAAEAALKQIQVKGDTNGPYNPSRKNCGDQSKNVKWFSHFEQCRDATDATDAEVLLFGDSHLARYKFWSVGFKKESINYAYGGDRIEHCLYRVVNGKLPPSVRLVILHIGTNNIQREGIKVVDGILQICREILDRRATVDIIVSGMLLKVGQVPLNTIQSVNHHLHNAFERPEFSKVFFLKHDKKRWCEVGKDGVLQPKDDLFLSDGVHLTDKGYKLLLDTLISTSKATACNLVQLQDRDLCRGNDPHRHLALGMPVTLEEGQDEPSFWSSRYNFSR